MRSTTRHHVFIYHEAIVVFCTSVDEGDDYPQRCRTTTRELASALGMAPEKVMMTFQSRFGREPWLMPYTDETLKMLGEKGVGHIQVMCPGFDGRGSC